jgi:hypothetical protein
MAITWGLLGALIPLILPTRCLEGHQRDIRMILMDTIDHQLKDMIPIWVDDLQSRLTMIHMQLQSIGTLLNDDVFRQMAVWEDHLSQRNVSLLLEIDLLRILFKVVSLLRMVLSSLKILTRPILLDPACRILNNKRLIKRQMLDSHDLLLAMSKDSTDLLTTPHERACILLIGAQQ